MTQTLVHTPVGSLAVRVVGSGPPAVLWHSLFMDGRSWERVERDLAEQRRLVSITGPGHGQSSDADHRYSMEDCARAATAVLDSLDIGEPVDWVGNAWGGHVGIIFAATWPARCRTLITIGTPVQAYDTRGRLETMVLLVLFRLVGPAQFIVKGVIDTMVSPTTRASDPDAVRLVRDGLVNADRAGLANAVNSISLHRRDLSPLLPQVTAPTLFITGADHKGWTPQQARDYSQLLPNGSAAIVADAAYLPPMEAPEETMRLISQFWAAHD